MKTHATLIRTLLLSALGVPFFACAGQAETCTSCGSGDGDVGGDGNLSSDGDGGGDGDFSGDGDGDTGDGDTGDGGGGTGDGDGAENRCTDPTPIEGSNGFVSCAEGFSHRPEGVACPNLVPRDEVIEWPDVAVAMGGAGGGDLPYTTSGDECSMDSDCGPDEMCRLVRTNPVYTGECAMDPHPISLVPDYARICDELSPACVTDDDCGADQACVCGAYRGHCAVISPVAGCRTDADCADGALCLAGYSCQQPGDECYVNADCRAGYTCALQFDAPRACIAPHPTVCGRPYLVAGSARLSEAVRCATWNAELVDVRVPTDPCLRSALTEHFTQLGLMEHASIAAFARFTLQLLSLGAPAELIEASGEAQIDETRHARFGFALASTFAGEPIGPSALSVDGALDDASWEAVFEATMREGCIGETRAALEASWAAERCADPLVRGVFEMIARDETRHAELAWRAAGWMLRQRPELRRMVPRILEGTRVHPEPSLHRPDFAHFWGILSNDELATCWAAAWSEIVVPCAEALLAPPIRRGRSLPQEGSSAA